MVAPTQRPIKKLTALTTGDEDNDDQHGAEGVWQGVGAGRAQRRRDQMPTLGPAKPPKLELRAAEQREHEAKRQRDDVEDEPEHHPNG
jgi:hypothetical protein